MGYLSKRKFEERESYLTTWLWVLIPALTLLGTLGRSMDWRLDWLGEFKMQAAALSFASGAMLYVVFGELLPEANGLWRSRAPALAAVVGILVGMLVVLL